jgi:hypothetical protein
MWYTSVFNFSKDPLWEGRCMVRYPPFADTYDSDVPFTSPCRVKMNIITMKSYRVVIPVMMELGVLETKIKASCFRKHKQ